MLSQESSPSEIDTSAVPLDRQVDLLGLDYEQTLRVIDGIVRTRIAVRGTASTAYLAFLGLGIDHKSYALCAAASILASLFAVQDIRSGWIYRQLLRRANDIERLLQRRMQTLDRPYDPYPVRRLRMEIEKYEFGVLTHIKAFHAKALLGVSASRLALYAAPIALGIVAATVV